MSTKGHTGCDKSCCRSKSLTFFDLQVKENWLGLTVGPLFLKGCPREEATRLVGVARVPGARPRSAWLASDPASHRTQHKESSVTM